MTTQTTFNLMTLAQVERAAKEFSKYAKEAVTAQAGPHIEGGVPTLNVFGSELAVLRLFHTYNGKGTVRQSPTHGWYFQKPMEFYTDIERGN